MRRFGRGAALDCGLLSLVRGRVETEAEAMVAAPLLPLADLSGTTAVVVLLLVSKMEACRIRFHRLC